MPRNTAAFVLTAILALAGKSFGDDAPAPVAPLVVHEWGTFTTLQDESGRLLRGINIDDEPLPDFVHRVRWGSAEQEAYAQKGVARSDSDVNMRLETPVMYFYSPAGLKTPLTLDVEVSFPGGWLTEFYPLATSGATGLKTTPDGRQVVTRLTPETIGTLAWHNITLGQPLGFCAAPPQPPQTDSHVWTAPRQVKDAATVTVSGEAERYLFYRGVANVKWDRNHVTLDVPHVFYHCGGMWLIDVRDDGTVAFGTGTPMIHNAADTILEMYRPKEILTAPHSKEKLTDLRKEMIRVLIAQGLFESEAKAMLDTWEAAYFKSPGLRLFSVVPQTETDRMLPLKFSVPVKLTRVMIRREEIITPQQRQRIQKIAAGPASNLDWFNTIIKSRPDKDALYKQLVEGRAPLADEAAAPADYKTYASLGRFRNALLLDELAQHPTDALQQFIDSHGIRYSTPGQ